MESRIIKTLKLKSHLVAPILAGTKTVTWRLFDDKDLQAGDRIDLINSCNGERFAQAEIINSTEKQIQDLTDDDLKNNNYRGRT